MSKSNKPLDSRTAVLNKKIEELESLLDRTSASRSEPTIPILDDLVDYDEESVIKPSYSDFDSTSHSQLLPENDIEFETVSEFDELEASFDLNDLFDDIEAKITRELDALMDILKASLKDSVMEEIRNQLTAEKIKRLNKK